MRRQLLFRLVVGAAEIKYRQDPILRTKLYRPRLPADVVRRERLLALMEGAARTPVTLVSGPAGYGKSLLVSEWIEEGSRDCAWVSLGEEENDLRLFLAYLLAAVEEARPGACAETGSIFTPDALPAVATIARCLGNDLSTLESSLVLVLDDYHHVAPSSPVHEVLEQLLQHPPPALHLILSSRSDPPLGLVKLRARGELTEVRVRDLRFTSEETAALLAKGAGVQVSAEALANLQQEVEGWGVGLRLVLVGLREAEDADAFLRSLRGGWQRAREYLMQEVLSALSPEVRRLLVRSSIFARFRAEALDAVVRYDSEAWTSGFDGGRLVATLREKNLFAIPLDADGEWIRYHHLFRDLLRMELEREVPEVEIAELHRRASAWFEEQGLVDEALGHALEAGNPQLAAAIVERHRMAEANLDRWFVLERWLSRLPEAVVRQRPTLLLARCSILMEGTRVLEVEALTEEIEALLGGVEGGEDLVAELGYLRGAVDVWIHCDSAGALRRLEAARQGLPADAHSFRNRVEFYAAVAGLLSGQGERELDRLEEMLLTVDPADSSRRARLLVGQTVVSLTMGDLHRARRSGEHLVAMVEETHSVSVTGWSHHLLAVTELHLLDLSRAREDFAAVTRRKYGVNRRIVLDALAGLSLVHQGLGQAAEAEAALQELEELARRTDPFQQAVAESCRARVALLRDELDTAAKWANAFAPLPQPGGTYFLLEDPSLTQARVWIRLGGEHDLARALDRLDEVTAEVEPLHFAGQLVEIDVLRALALEASGRRGEALDVLGGVLGRAVPRGWLRPFAEERTALEELLGQLAEQAEGEEVRALLRALDERPAFGSPVVRAAPSLPSRRVTPVTPVAPVSAVAPELLTNRELDVLELLAQRLRDKEIAGRLGISGETVKWHLRHVYEKLQVTDRRRAVAKATALGLLATKAE